MILQPVETHEYCGASRYTGYIARIGGAVIGGTCTAIVDGGDFEQGRNEETREDHLRVGRRQRVNVGALRSARTRLTGISDRRDARGVGGRL